MSEAAAMPDSGAMQLEGNPAQQQPTAQPIPTAANPQPFDPRFKSPRLASFLSAVPGLGQIYVGFYVRGFCIMATVLLLGLFAGNASGNLDPIPSFMVLFAWLANVIDAGRMAALYNHAMAGTGRFEMPEDFNLPAMGGSVVGGALLVGFGAIALSNTLFGIRLDWIEDWWPVLPLAIGGYLLARGIMDLNSDSATPTHDTDD